MLGNRKVAIRAWMRWHRNGIGQSAITLADMAALGAGSVVRGNAAITLADMTAAGVGDAGPETIQSLGMMGGQFNANDGMRTPVEIDLMDRARALTYTSGPQIGNNSWGMAFVSSIVRASNVCTVTLSVEPGESPGDFVMLTGMKHVLTCISDPSFSSDQDEITVTNQTHYTYPNTGPDATASIANSNDCAACILASVDCDSDGEPIEDFKAVVSALVGSETSNADLDGAYNVVFPAGLPTNFTVSGGTISNYTSGGADSTATLTLAGTDTSQTILTFTGVPGDGSFVRPTIRRNDQSTDPDFVIRADYATVMGRYALHRWMDAQHMNSNPSQVSWATRAKVMNGLTWTPEKIIAASNQVMQPPWWNAPTMAADDYTTGAAELFRDNLHISLPAYYGYANEPWNNNLPAFRQHYWLFQQMKAEVGGIFHESDYNNSDISSIVRSGGNLATVTTVRPLPATVFTGSTADMVMQDSSFNGTGKTLTKTGANTFTYASNGSNGAASSLNGVIYTNLASNLLNDSRRDVDELLPRWVGRRVYEHAQLIKTAYGGVLNDRARVIYEDQSADQNQFSRVLNFVFPWLEATYGVPIKSWLYAVAMAPYARGAGGSASAITTDIMAYMDDHLDDLHGAKHLATKYGVRLFAYEGGSDLVGVNASLTDAVYAHSSFRTAEAYCWNKPLGYGYDLVVPYKTDIGWPGVAGSSTWSSSTDDMASIAVGATTSYKQLGIDDVLLAAPPAILETNLIPGTVKYMNGGSEVFDDKTGGFNMNQMRVLNSATSTVETLCYVPTAGTYDLTIWGKCKAGGGTNGCRVYVMEPDATEALAGTLALFDNGTDADVGTAGGYASPTALSVNFATAGWKILKCRGAADPQPDRLAVSKIVAV